MGQLTLGMIKPDAIASGKAGLIIAHLQREGFQVRAARLTRLTRAQAEKRMRDLGVLVNAGGHVPVDESPDCYKPAAEVIRAVTAAGLAEVEVTLRPIASIKGSD